MASCMLLKTECTVLILGQSNECILCIPAGGGDRVTLCLVYRCSYSKINLVGKFGHKNCSFMKFEKSCENRNKKFIEKS